VCTLEGSAVGEEGEGHEEDTCSTVQSERYKS
jgi:hypothetical protein